jgi:hypothetical protein
MSWHSRNYIASFRFIRDRKLCRCVTCLNVVVSCEEAGLLTEL